MTYRDKIRAIADGRGVQHLLHFTQAINLTGIVRDGLRSRQDMQPSDYLPSSGDRWDEDPEAISLSIEQVNDRMFARKLKLSGHDDWVLLVLPAAILWTHDCRFCWRSAATNEIKNYAWFRGGPSAFSRMFAGSSDERSQLPDWVPTDPQAEVQVLQPIAPDLIQGAVVYRPQILEPVQEILNGLAGYQRPVVTADR